MREASRLLDGVRQGQPLGALLGYRVERLLHETVVDNGRSMDRFIAPLRRVAPLVARAERTHDRRRSRPSPPTTSSTAWCSIAAGRKSAAPVVAALNDGRAWAPAICRRSPSIFDTLADAIDGLSDALTAEVGLSDGARQHVAHGQHAGGDRAGRRAAAGARGGAHAALRHVAHASPAAADERPNVEHARLGERRRAAARSSAEPMLNFWAFKLLGDGSKIRCTIERLDDATGSVVETRTLPLSELGITPLDVVYGVEAANTTAQPGMSLSEIEQQVLYHAKHKTGGFDPLATLRLQHARPANLAAGEMTLFDVLEQARGIRRLLNVARGADPEDLNPPERTGQGDDRSHRARSARRQGRERAQRRAQGDCTT